MKIKMGAIILILGLIVFLFLVWPRHINLEIKGVEYTQEDKTNSEIVSIKINGQINNQFWGTRRFIGRIYCTKLNLNGEVFNLAFNETNKSYLSVRKENGESLDYGEIFSNKTMDELLIVKGDNVFVFPAKNRDAAEKIAKIYFKNEYNYYFNNQ